MKLKEIKRCPKKKMEEFYKKNTEEIIKASQKLRLLEKKKNKILEDFEKKHNCTCFYNIFTQSITISGLIEYIGNKK